MIKTWELARKKWRALGQKVKKITPWRLTILGILGIVALALIIFICVSIMSLGKVYPRVYVGDLKVGGLTRDQLVTTLKSASEKTTNQPINLTYQGKTYLISPADALWKFDINQTADAAMGIGRDQSGWRSLWERFVSPFHHRVVDPMASYDQDSLNNKLSAIAGPISHPASDANATFVSGMLKITPESNGQVIDTATLAKNILAQWNTFSPGTVVMTMTTDQPKVIAGPQSDLQNQVDGLLSTSVIVKWPTGKAKLTENNLRDMVDFVGNGKANSRGQQTLAAEFTQSKIRQFLLAYATAHIDKPAVEPKLAMVNNVLTVISNSQEGTVVDLDASAALIAQALNPTPTDAVTVALAMKNQDPGITKDNVASLGVTDLLGEGITSFAGSPSNRVANIKRGVALLNGVLIKPGEEFSTLQNLGIIDASNGFVEGLVIKGTRTVPDFGGGLCQVSTTLFRSVLAAGLKVTARTNHSYRVSYYEPPVGLDATIFSPAPDFKFLNDTPGYILVQGKVVGTKAIFDLYGTSDGRVSNVSTPQILSTTPAGDPIYINTDTLDKGVVQQVEHAHDGATAVATYTVTRNGQMINKQVFHSTYVPWPAQFLVGTREPVPTN